MNRRMNSQQEALFGIINKAIVNHNDAEKPYVMLSYAQTLNGSIAITNTHPLALSCSDSLLFTHRLRSLSDAILVGVGTVLSD
ncbi:MAG: dihydrofolate reductase family protein, partial [Calditrichota bacterium]